MADLLTPRELALWTSSTVGKSEAEVAADPFAVEVIDKVSQMAQFLGGHDGTKTDADGAIIPTWTLEAGPDQAPFDVRMVVLQVCKRAYENPKQVTSEGGVGPIGGDTVLDVAALLLELTDSERQTLTRHNVEGDPNDEGLFVLATTRGRESTLKEPILYVSDDQQINMHEGQSAWPSWDIPLFNPGDPGDPNLY